MAHLFEDNFDIRGNVALFMLANDTVKFLINALVENIAQVTLPLTA